MATIYDTCDFQRSFFFFSFLIFIALVNIYFCISSALNYEGLKCDRHAIIEGLEHETDSVMIAPYGELTTTTDRYGVKQKSLKSNKSKGSSIKSNSRNSTYR